MEQSVKVVVFSTPTCSHCNNLKRYLKEKNIKFKDIDISRDIAAAKDMQTKTNGNTGVPVILINNRPIIGFDKNKINSLLNIK